MERMRDKQLEREIGERLEIERLPDGRVRISGLIFKVNDLVEKGPIEQVTDVQGRQVIDEQKLVEYPIDDGNFGGDPLFGRNREDNERIQEQYENLRYKAILKQAPEGAIAFEVLKRHPTSEFLTFRGISLQTRELLPPRKYSWDLIRYLQKK